MTYEATLDNDVPFSEPTEATRLRTGDPDALAAVVGRYQHRLYRYFIRLVRDRATADDLFQQTWLRVVSQIHRYDPARSFDTWLFAIAHNTAIDLLRRRPAECLEDYPAHAPDALDALLAGERAQHLAAAMEALPALYREVLTLRFEEGMKLEEIAAVIHAPLSTVKSRVHRGMEALRRHLP
jgi:RNA polymerase sigma-70 factor (ECF subfamily)